MYWVFHLFGPLATWFSETLKKKKEQKENSL